MKNDKLYKIELILDDHTSLAFSGLNHEEMSDWISISRDKAQSFINTPDSMSGFERFRKIKPPCLINLSKVILIHVEELSDTKDIKAGDYIEFSGTIGKCKGQSV
jgi:hypothetical protein